MRSVLSHCLQKAKAGYGKATYFFQSVRQDMTELSPNRNHTFFGYYDKTPFSLDNNLVLGMNLESNLGKKAYIGYFDLCNENNFKVIGETNTWSWQLGARLQWMPNQEQEVIGYNKIVNGKFGFVLQNIHSGKIESEYTDPVFDVSPDGRYAISINFARLYNARAGYGYGNFSDPVADSLCPEDDGIVLLDLGTKSRKLLISLKSLALLESHPSMKGAEHYVNHILFSPSGKRFLFLHHWHNGGKSYTRPITTNMSGEDLFILDGEVNLSHYTWKSDEELLIHTSKHPYGTKFNLYEDKVGKKKTIGIGVLKESGHPSYSPDGSKLIVDTYPDKSRRQHLLLCNSDGSLIKEVGYFYSPIEFSGDEKCDLHPRWDRIGNMICVDSAHRGRRAMYIIKLN